MDKIILDKMDAVAAVMESNGEGQPDGRRGSSPRNGEEGGGRRLDYGAIAEAFTATLDAPLRWHRGQWWAYARRRGAYELTTEAEVGSCVAAFLSGATSPAPYSKNAERSVVGALRANYVPQSMKMPCFLGAGTPAVGWVAMENGMLDVEAAALGDPAPMRPHTPDFFSPYCFPYPWDPSAECPRFMRFLEDVQPDQDGREMLQMMTGLLLVPDTSYNVFFILYGEGGCGKSTFLRIVGAMLGDGNVCSVPLSMISEKHTTHRLTQHLANLVDDSPTSDGKQSFLSVEGVLKLITSGGKLHVEPKGQDPWEAPATARCVFCQNPPLPQFADRSNGLWDRLRIVPFPRRFRGTAEQNPRLADEIIAAELPGIFAWAVRGLGMLRALNEFPRCEAGATMADEHRETCDREGAFLRERYKIANGEFTPSVDIYTSYRNWCDVGGYHPKNAANFAQEVRRVFGGAVKNVRKRLDGGNPVSGFLNLGGIGLCDD